MYENIGVVVGHVWSLGGNLVRGAEVQLLYVSGPNGRMRVAGLDKQLNPLVETDKAGAYALPFLWSAADIGEAMMASVSLWADTEEELGTASWRVTAKARNTTTGYLVRNVAGLIKGMLPDLGSLPGMADFGKDLILAFRKIKFAPFVKAGMMSTENFAILAGADFTLDA